MFWCFYCWVSGGWHSVGFCFFGGICRTAGVVGEVVCRLRGKLGLQGVAKR